LKSESLVRLGFLAAPVLPSSRITGSIGSIAAARQLWQISCGPNTT
jgi:hypothetical protein